MDYLIEQIDEEILDLAKVISEDVPYWMHARPVGALKRALKRCQSLEHVALDATTLSKNRDIILNCLEVFKQK